MDTPSLGTTPKSSKILIILAALLVMSVVIGTFLLMVLYKPKSTPDDTTAVTVCTTLKCMQGAADIKSKISPEADPCDDFYSFACGGAKDADSQFTDGEGEKELEDAAIKALLTLLTSTANMSNKLEPLYVRNLRNLYMSCQNETLIETRGNQPLIKAVEDLGGWPMVKGEAWKPKWDLQTTLAQFRKRGFIDTYLISVNVTQDCNNNNSKSILTVGSPVVSVEGDVKKLAMSFGAQAEVVEEQLGGLMEFIQALDEIAKSGSTEEPIKIRELQKECKGFAWLKFINSILPREVYLKDNSEISASKSYLGNLIQLISTTQNRTVFNYLMWRVHADNLKLLAPTDCYELMKNNFKIPLTMAYANKFVREASSLTAGIFSDIRDAFQRMLDEAKWLDAQTRRNASQKLKAMRAIIGYPEQLHANRRIRALTQSVEFHAEKFFENMLLVQRATRDSSLYRLFSSCESYELTDLSENLLATDFIYDKDKNLFVYPLASFRHQEFKTGLPLYVDFAGIGWTLSNILIEGFEDLVKMHPNQSTCFTEQYKRLKSGDWKASSEAESEKKERRERSSDASKSEDEVFLIENVGLKTAYKAFRNYRKSNANEHHLPNLNHTVEQSFWIVAAQKNCDDKKRPSKVNGENIVRGAFQNMEAFAKAFHCPANSSMVLKQRCKIL